MLDCHRVFKPASTPLAGIQIIEIEPDEFEAVRICDAEKMSQIQAAERMKISRGTVQRLLENGRFKIITALLAKKAIRIKTGKGE